MRSDWQVTTLGDAFNTATGTTPPKKNASLYGDYMPLVKPPELCDAELDSATDGLSEAGASVARTLPSQSILVSCIGNLGKIGLNTIPIAFNQQINAILPDMSLAIPKFMFYQVLSSDFRVQLEALASGTTVPIVNKSKFNSIRVVLPPLDEQQQIVALLDEAFDGLATVRAQAEQNLANARALFESHLNSVFTEVGEGWVKKPLSELCEIKHGFAFKSQFFDTEGDYVLLTPGNFYESGGYRDRGAKQKYYTGEIPRDYVLDEGDLLVAMTEQAAGLLGSPIIVPESDRFLHNQRLGLVTGRPGVPWSNSLFFHVFNTQAVRQALHDSASGVKVRHTSPTKIGDVVVSFPTSVSEQEEVDLRLRDLKEESQRLEALYQQKIDALNELKRSLLHHAFSGQL